MGEMEREGRVQCLIGDRTPRLIGECVEMTCDRNRRLFSGEKTGLVEVDRLEKTNVDRVGVITDRRLEHAVFSSAIEMEAIAD